MPSLRIEVAIIGAGPAGLMLARLLTVPSTAPSAALKLKLTIFEADPTPIARSSNGGTLDLHPSTGLLAVKKAGLYDEFLKNARYDGTSLKVCDKNAKVWMNIPASKEGEMGNPEIDRVRLRGLLLGSLKGVEGVEIVWGLKAVRVCENVEGNKGFEVEFKSGEKRGGFDLVVGADGLWSRTRSSYLDTITKPEFSRVVGYKFSIPNVEVTAKEEWKFVNKGSMFSFGDRKGITAQQLGDGSLHVNAWIVANEGMAEDGFVKKSNTEVLEENFHDWSEQLRALIRKAKEDSPDAKLLFALPEDYTWEHREGVTLLGDAAHVMLPFAGEGVNLAFEDAMKLSEAILGGPVEYLDHRIREFEVDMFSRAKRAQRMTRGMTNAMMFTPGAPRNSVDSYILSKLEYEFPNFAKWGWPIMWVAVHGWFSIVRMRI